MLFTTTGLQLGVSSNSGEHTLTILSASKVMAASVIPYELNKYLQSQAVLLISESQSLTFTSSCDCTAEPTVWMRSGLCVAFHAAGRRSTPPRTWWHFHRVTLLGHKRAIPYVWEHKQIAESLSSLKLLQATSTAACPPSSRIDRRRTGLVLGGGSLDLTEEVQGAKKFCSYQSVRWHGSSPILQQRASRRGGLTPAASTRRLRRRTYVSTWRPGPRVSQPLLL